MKIQPSRRALLGLLLACSGIVCFGQQSPPAGIPDNRPEVVSKDAPAVFRASANDVQVPVVVRDSSGRAVGNLHAEDFRLKDNGRLQVISRFSMERLGHTEEFPISEGENSRPNPTASFSSSVTAMPDRFVAWLADDLSLAPEDFMVGRQAALKHFETLRPSDRAAVYSVSGFVSGAFTDDRAALREALIGINSLNRAATYVDPTLHCSAPPHQSGIMTPYKADLIVQGDRHAILACSYGHENDPHLLAVLNQNAESIVHFNNRDIENYLGALERLIDKLSTMPGDRLIVALSPGTYVPSRYQAMKEAILAKAIRARVVISGVDVRGVYISHDWGGPDPSTTQDYWGLAENNEKAGFMEDLASGTGGVYLRGNNDLGMLLRRAASAPDYAYVLGFTPMDLKFDGKLHTLSVALVNQRGLTIQARGNYRAPIAAPDQAEEEAQRLDEAFFSSAEVKDLPVRVQTQFVRDGSDATVDVIARVDIARLPFRKEDGRNRDTLTMVIGLFDQNGNYVSAIQKTIDMRLKDENMNAWLRNGVETKTEFNVKPGKYLVRLVVRDDEGQSMAEQSTGVDIPW